MTDLAHWQEINQAYLGAALRWLRLLLQHAGATPDPGSDHDNLSSGRVDERASAAADVAAAREMMLAAEAAQPPPAAIILGELLGLSRFELDVLLLCAAMELDSRTAVTLRPCSAGRESAVPLLRARAALVSRRRVGCAVARASTAPLAPHRDQSARRAATDDERLARRRAHRQLLEGLELSRRSAVADGVSDASGGCGRAARLAAVGGRCRGCVPVGDD